MQIYVCGRVGNGNAKVAGAAEGKHSAVRTFFVFRGDLQVTLADLDCGAQSIDSWKEDNAVEIGGRLTSSNHKLLGL